MTNQASCVIGEASCTAHTAPHKLCVTHTRCVSECWASWTAPGGYGSLEHAAELSRRLADERVKVDARDKRIASLEGEIEKWKRRAEESERVEDGLLAEANQTISEAREKLAEQIVIKMMMGDDRERFLRALQGIASEPCASRLVSGRVCDQVDFLCASCKAKQAILESERRGS